MIPKKMRLRGAYFRLKNVFGRKIAGSQHSSPSDSLGQSRLKKLTVMTYLGLKHNTYRPVSEQLPDAKLRVTAHCAAAFFLPVPKWCTDLDQTLLYILIHRTYTKFVWKTQMLALGVCFPQPSCWSAGRMFAASKSCLQYYRRIVSFHNNDFDEMPCKGFC